MAEIVVLGGGFAGLWSAVGAARKLDELGRADVGVTLVNRDAYHAIRVRNYESDLAAIRVRLDDVLGPVGLRRVEGDVAAIDPVGRTVTVTTCGTETLPYDRLVFALGSQLVRPPVPGLAEHGFDVDTFAGAARLRAHLATLPERSPVVVVGAGLTGIEIATELADRFTVTLADRNPHVGSDMGDAARPVIEQALAALGVATRVGVGVTAVTPDGLTLGTGEVIRARAVIWCAGMRANPLTAAFGVPLDPLGRLPVDEYLRATGVPGVFAAGDSARAMLDDTHASVMSCQHGRPMGRFAGHNVVCDLLGLPMLPLHIAWYVTVLDLGAWGAVYTEGWDRHVVATGATAKATKVTINCQRIYPPTGDRAAILAAAAPVVQTAPAVRA